MSDEVKKGPKARTVGIPRHGTRTNTDATQTDTDKPAGPKARGPQAPKPSATTEKKVEAKNE